MDNYGLMKREHGQWMTEGNPFYMPVFKEWLDGICAHENITACEPYAGSLSLIRHIRETMPTLESCIKWTAFDIQPNPEPVIDDVNIITADTLLNIPGDYDLIITNPPYLARNSATRRHLPFNDGGKPYDDLYQVALDTCLQHADHAALIIPESFITSKFDKSRCSHVISLKAGLFNDTDCPVCLALFDDDVSMYGNDGRMTMIHDNTGRMIDSLSGLELKSMESLYSKGSDIGLTFNDPHGDVGLHAVDSGNTADIRFVRGMDSDISPDEIKVSSRSLTRISRKDGKPITDAQIMMANHILDSWRDETNDVFMTSFKGARKDGKYRRRLAFREAGMILRKAINENS